MNGLIQLIYAPFKWLKDYPILFKGKGFNIVSFGLFGALNAMAIVSVLFYYLHIRGHEITSTMLFLLPLGGLMVWTGAKLMHLVALGRIFFTNPFKYLTETGFYFQGGIIGAFVWALVFTSSTQVPFSIILDGLCLGALLGQVFGRLGCFNYGCCFGKPTTSILGIAYEHEQSKVLRLRPHMKGTPLHPAQLYKAGMNLFTFVALMLLLPLSMPHGAIAIFYLIYHGITRMIMEKFRDDIYFDKQRNPITKRFALIAIVSTIPFIWFGYRADDTFLTSSGFLREHGFSTLFTFYANHSILIGWTILIGILIFIGYGIHGQSLGKFPLSERSNNYAHKSHDHRSRTLWD